MTPGVLRMLLGFAASSTASISLLLFAHKLRRAAK